MSDIPNRMRAAVIDRFGGPEVLHVDMLPVPVIEPNEVLIALHTSGVGSWDADIRGGWYPSGRPKFPIVLGTDGAGTVAAVGSRIRRFKMGDNVYSYSWDSQFEKGGFYAEYVTVIAEKVAHVPKLLDLEHAGAIPTTGLTALQGIDEALQVKRNESVIIQGASGGVGTLAVQFAKLRGARVIAIASGAAGVTLVQLLGVDAAIDGHSKVLPSELKRAVPDGADALLALAGGKTLESCLEALRPGGRCAYPNGVEPEPKKRLRVKIISYDAISDVGHFKRFNKAVEEAKLQVAIAASFDVGKAADAHRRLKAGHVLGKIVLRINE
jgi:NADPH2:quinone reductase